MSNSNISQRDPSSYSGSYEIIIAELFTNQDDQNSIDIRGIIEKIIINESIYSAGIGVEIRIMDGISLLDNIKLLGNEKIFLGVVQKGRDTDKEKKFIIELFISNVTNFARPKPGLDAYSFICVSKHVYENQFGLLDHGFSDDIGGNIKAICRGKLNISDDQLDIDTGYGSVKGVYPSLKPIDGIRFQMNSSSDYLYFYEDLKGIKHLHSHTDLIKKDSIGIYTTAPFYVHPIGTEENYLEQQEKILKFSSNLDISKLSASSNGVYSSEIFDLDIYTKEHKTTPLRGFIKDLLNDHGSVSKNNVIFNFEDEPQSRRYNTSSNSGAYNKKKENIHRFNNAIALKESYKHDLNTHMGRIITYGNLDVSVGNIISLIIPPTGIQDKSDYFDGYFTGRYIITDIIHRFESDYQTEMTIKKDSFIFDTDKKRILVDREPGERI